MASKALAIVFCADHDGRAVTCLMETSDFRYNKGYDHVANVTRRLKGMRTAANGYKVFDVEADDGNTYQVYRDWSAKLKEQS